MQKPNPAQDEPQSLARMMHLDEGCGGLWEPDELGAILRHQLDAPVEFDLSRLGFSPRDTLQSVSAAGAMPIHSFRDLFDHPNPPIELLEWTKQFAKACRSRSDGPLPDEVATVLYFSAITTAMAKCGRRISRLDDQSLRYGLRWALSQPWLDDATRGLFRKSLAALADR